MSKFNQKARDPSRTTNHEGAEAFSLGPFTELYSLVTTTTLQNKFYETESTFMDRLRNLIRKVNDPELIGKLAVYVRENMYLRSVPIVLAVELARQYGGTIAGKTITRIIQRVDEITEALAYYAFINGCQKTVGAVQMKRLYKLSKQLQKGVARAFNKFDAYQFGKYNRDTEIKLRDALFITHPKPKNTEQKAIFDKIVDGTLETPYTWETELSKNGNNAETWEKLLDSKKVGYMALIRNLRNILDVGVSSDHIKRLCKHLSNPNAVVRSKLFPFRFFSAYKELIHHNSPYTSTVLNALEDAVIHTAERITGYDYDTTVLIACDVSSSMEEAISQKSTVQLFDIGLILAMLLQNRCKSVITGMFGDTWKVDQFSRKAILSNTLEMHRREGEVGYSTNGYKVIEYLIGNKIRVDKIMMFTDCQLWDSDYNRNDGETLRRLWYTYKKYNPDTKIYFFDLNGYGTTPISTRGKDVYFISGWSDKIFDMLNAVDNQGSIIEEIKKVKI